MEPLLQRYFGHTQFRAHQKEIIEHILRGEDCMVVMPAGSGKSLCYQMPAMITGKTAVVISPLLSQMQDQVISLKERGIKAEYLGTPQADKDAQTNAENGNVDILYMSPQKASLLRPRFWNNLLSEGICLLAVDEAHCISQWGHDYRKEYASIHTLRIWFKNVPFVALTSTATKKVQDDILCSLHLSKPFVVIGSCDLSNIFYGVKSLKSSPFFLEKLVQQISRYSAGSSSTIIYCTIAEDMELIYKSLLLAQVATSMYNGRLRSKNCEASYRSFMRNETKVLVATCTFGMRINKPNIQYIIHYRCPKSLAAYYQESTRCGRDGLASECWMYYSKADFKLSDTYALDYQSENQRKAFLESNMEAEKYCLLATCRRKYILQYFGEKNANACGTPSLSSGFACYMPESYDITQLGHCDNCTRETKTRDVAQESFLLLSCIKSLPGKCAVKMAIDVLRGSREKRIRDKDFDKHPLYGVGKYCSSIWWGTISAQLTNFGYLKENVVGSQKLVSVAQRGKRFLHTENVVLRDSIVITLTAEMIDEESRRSLSLVEDMENENLSEGEKRLYQVLLDTRRELAKENGTLTCAICNIQTIKRLMRTRPSSKAKLKKLDGVNEYFLVHYGERFLRCITQLSQELGLEMDCKAIMRNKRKLDSIFQPKITKAKTEAWDLWQHRGLSFQEIARTPRKRGHPIKEQTVISYISDYIYGGNEITERDMVRFCHEIGLTVDTALQIRDAIEKVGLEDRLKPVKAELPNTVTYNMIKAYLALESCSLPAEVILGNKSTSVSSDEIDESPLIDTDGGASEYSIW